MQHLDRRDDACEGYWQPSRIPAVSYTHLLCKKMKLGQMDASGRAGVTETADVVEVPADTVIVAVGEKIDKMCIRDRA